MDEPANAQLAQLQQAYRQAVDRAQAPSPRVPPVTIDAPAGEYVLTCELFDQPLSEPGEEFRFRRYRRGDTVTLTAPEARRLVAAGAVSKDAPPRRSEYAAALAAYRRARDLEAAAGDAGS